MLVKFDFYFIGYSFVKWLFLVVREIRKLVFIFLVIEVSGEVG